MTSARVTHAVASRSSLPVWVSIVVLAVLSYWLVGPRFATIDGFWAVAKLATFVAIVGAGQGFVILAGGIDLSIPATVTLGGVLFTGLANGQDEQLWWVIPLVLATGALIGFANGAGTVFLNVSPVVVTIAVGSIVGSLVLVYTGGFPHGSAAPLVEFLIHGDIGSVPALAIGLIAFAVAVAAFMSLTTMGQYIYAVGNGERAARFSGIRTGGVITGAYVLSGLLAALAGITIAGFTGQSDLRMGDVYLLPSIAAVVIGGTAITGGRGHYLGTLGGALFLSLLGAILISLAVSEGARQILFGAVVLVAVVMSGNRGRALEE